MNNPEIKYLENDAIDLKKWDACIANSLNGIVYAYSWFLDRICDDWDALVYGDYLYVMPLVRAKKFGISYVYQPFFTQQLGVFSAFPVDKEMVNSFLNSIPPDIRLVEIKLNTQNVPTTDTFSIEENITYHLGLNKPYGEIQKAYHKNTVRNLKKAKDENMQVSNLYNIDEFIAFTSENLNEKSSEIKVKHYQNLKRTIGFAIYHQIGELIGVFNERNQLIAAVFFVQANNKVIYLAASSSAEGADKKAMFLLIDNFIERKSGNELVLDFEGSNIPGVARFYEGFGAKAKSYFSVKRNTLPWPIKLLKR